MTATTTTAELPLTIVPANQASCKDLQTLFGTRGAAAVCQCPRYKLQPKESFAGFTVEERTHRRP